MKPKIRELLSNHQQWPEVLKTIQRLTKAGFTAHVAGGSVRDALIGRTPHDFDVATDARPDDVEKLFKNSIAIGKAFGVIILPFDGYQIEVATFRRDGEYGDGRHPKDVHFSDACEDALRRDFTVNALFYDVENDRVIDHVNGLNDLKLHVLRAVGEPRKRFEEDKLRILRAVRLSAQLNFQIDSETLNAMAELSAKIIVVSKERVTDEIKKLVLAKNLRHGVEVLLETNLWVAIWPHVEFHKDHTLWGQFLNTLTHSLGSFEMLLSLIEVFEHEFWRQKAGAAKEHYGAGLGPFILSREQKKRIEFLLRGREHLAQNSWQGLLDLNENDGPLLTEFCTALTSVGLFEKGKVADWIARFLDVADEAGALPKPLVNGDDLIQLGFSASEKIGQVLNDIYMNQITQKIKSRAKLLELAARLKN